MNNKSNKEEKQLTVKDDNPAVLEEVQALQQMVDLEVEKRKILTKYISAHMKRGTDYGSIHINKNCPNKYNPSARRAISHFSKDCLFKPGSEKFSSLMKLTPKFRKDVETWEMTGNKLGLICYVCELTDSKGQIVGEGRGSADISEKLWSMNNAIKIAQKRAQIDAVLRTGGLSDFFTQDLEDISDSEPLTARQMVEEKEKRQTNDTRICSAHDKPIQMLRGVSKSKLDANGNPKIYWWHIDANGDMCFGNGLSKGQVKVSNTACGFCHAPTGKPHASNCLVVKELEVDPEEAERGIKEMNGHR